MMFDIIIGNPPYQSNTGGGSNIELKVPLYQKFIEFGMNMHPKKLVMLIPSRWVNGGKGLDDFRTNLILSKRIKSIHSFEDSSNVFDGVLIGGGVQYIDIDNDMHSFVHIYNMDGDERYKYDYRPLNEFNITDMHGKCQYTVLIDNHAANIARKVIDKTFDYMGDYVLQVSPFRLDSKFKDSEVYSDKTPIKVIGSSGKSTYTSEYNITQNNEHIHKYKVITGKVNPGIRSSNGSQVINKPRIIYPGEVCNLSYLVIGSFDTELEALNCLNYYKTKFVRFLILITQSGMNMTARNYAFVPRFIFDKQYTDKSLYSIYNLSEDDINYIEKRVRQME